MAISPSAMSSFSTKGRVLVPGPQMRAAPAPCQRAMPQCWSGPPGPTTMPGRAMTSGRPRSLWSFMSWRSHSALDRAYMLRSVMSAGKGVTSVMVRVGSDMS